MGISEYDYSEANLTILMDDHCTELLNNASKAGRLFTRPELMSNVSKADRLFFGENGELKEKFFEEHFCAGRKNEIYVERWIEIGDREKG